MADETTPSENNATQTQQIPVAPKPVAAQPISLDEEKTSTSQSPVISLVEEKKESSPVAETQAPIVEEKAPVAAAKPTVKSLELPKAKYTVNKVAAPSSTPKKIVEVKKDDNPSIMSVAVDFVAAAVAVAFAVMIVLDI